MLRRIGLVIGGLFLSLIFANVYYIGFCFVFIFVLGVQNELFWKSGFWACFLLAVATIAYLFRESWAVPTTKQQSEPSNDVSDGSTR